MSAIAASIYIYDYYFPSTLPVVLPPVARWSEPTPPPSFRAEVDARLQRLATASECPGVEVAVLGYAEHEKSDAQTASGLPGAYAQVQLELRSDTAVASKITKAAGSGKGPAARDDARAMLASDIERAVGNYLKECLK